MRTQIFNALKITALAITLSFGISYVYAWTAPTVAPAGGNVLAPINTSGTIQTKTGGFNIATVTGKVGIGTTNPTGMLQIGTLSSGLNGNINGASNPTRLIVNGADGSEAALTLGHYSAGYGLDLWVPANPSAPWPTYIDNINRYSGFRFRNNTSATPVELMTIDETGKVGIGTATPSQTLTVAGAIGATGDICTTTTGPSVCLGSAGGTSVMTGNTDVMALPAATANYTVMISGTYSTCDNFARNLLLDGVVVKTFADVGGDQAGCDQDTIQAKLINVAAGTHTWSLSGGSNKDYLWTAYTNGAVLSTITDNGLGYGQTWQDVTASRASGVSYTNSTGKPIEISVTASASTGPLSLYLYVNGVKRWGMYSGNYVGNQAATIIVPSGSTYSATVSPTLLSWHELR